MAAQTSVESIVSRLEAQIAFDQEREVFHAAQETFHREQRAAFAAEIEKLKAVLEAFKTASATAAELETRAAAVTPPKPNLDIGRKASLTRMIRRIIETRPAGDVFGTKLITSQINRHFRDRLRRPVKAKLVSITLKRLSRQGELRQVRAGRPHHEALYSRVEGKS